MSKYRIFFKNKGVINGVWLYVLQFFNTVIPLITIPYITRILTPYNYGEFSSALNLTSYFLVIVEYGFNWSGARKIAIAKNKEDITKIYSSIFFARLFLMFISFILLFLLSLILKIPTRQYYCMLILFLMIIGTSIQQIGLFQGLQRMKFISIVTVTIRTIATIMTFIFINKSDQVIGYTFLYSISFLILGIICMIYTHSFLRIKIKFPGLKVIFIELKDGWYLFLSSGMGKVFAGIGITALQFFSTKQEVGAYSAIQKIPQMMIIAYTPFSQAIFPIMSKKIAENDINITKMVGKVIGILMPILLIMIISMAIFSNSIVTLAFGKAYSDYSILLIPLIIWASLSIINNLLGTQILVASGKTQIYSKLFVTSMIVMIACTLVLCKLYGGFGVALASMLGEGLLTFLLYLYIYKKGIKND
ncbi:flippase [Enterococcus hirae]|nr:flippase [Enterococcus hirae]